MNIDETLNERGTYYGPFIDNAMTAQLLKYTAHNTQQWENLDADQQEAIDMICAKLSRILSGANPDHIDNWTDIAGYATLVKNRLEEDQQGDGPTGSLGSTYYDVTPVTPD